jgi:hypothetical protein
MVENRKSKKSRLRVCRVVDVPLHEVSGICLRRSRTGRMPLIAVGDRASKIAWFSLPRSDKGRIDWHTSDSSKLSGSMLPEDDPQIEAVCADGLGRILLLQETPPRVEFIDPKASKVIASIELAVEGGAEIARAWSDPKGSRGEGIVLLPGGHLLVAKEKKPAALIELGPPDSRSRGLLRGGALMMASAGRPRKGANGSWLSQSGFPTKHSPKPAPTSVTSKLVRMVVSICSVTSPPQLRGSMISRRVAAPQRSLMHGGSAIWMASRKALHSPHRVTRSSGSTHASRAEISSC